MQGEESMGKEFTGGSTEGGTHLIWFLLPADHHPSLLMSS